MTYGGLFFGGLVVNSDLMVLGFRILLAVISRTRLLCRCLVMTIEIRSYSLDFFDWKLCGRFASCMPKVGIMAPCTYCSGCDLAVSNRIAWLDWTSGGCPDLSDGSHGHAHAGDLVVMVTVEISRWDSLSEGVVWSALRICTV